MYDTGCKTSPGDSCIAAGGARALLDIQPYTGAYIKQYYGEAATVKALGGLEPAPGLTASQGCTQDRAHSSAASPC